MRAWSFIIFAVLLGLRPALAADYDDSGQRPTRHAAPDAYGYRDHYGYAYSRYPLQPTPYIVAPPATVMIVPPNAAPAPLHYAPPPPSPLSPPLITALPIVGGFLVPTLPQPATVLDEYDHSFDYNQ